MKTTYNRTIKMFMGILMMLVFAFYSCKKEEKTEPEDNGPGEPLETIVSANTKVFDDDAWNDIVSIDTNNFTFEFTSGEYTENLEVNDIMVDGVSSTFPYGFLRKVVSMNENGSTITVITQQATIAEAIEQGSLRLDSMPLKSSDIASIQLAEGFKINRQMEKSDFLAFDFYFEHDINGADYAKLKGSFYFNLDFNFILDWGWDLDITFIEVKYFKTSVEVEEIASIGIDVTSPCDLEEEMDFASIVFSPITVFVGPVPIVFIPKVVLKINTDLTVTGEMRMFATQNYNREIGIVYEEDEWSKLNSTDPPPGSSLLPPGLQGNSNLTVSIGPEASLKLYGIAGPYINLFLSSTLDATESTNGYNMDYSLDLESNAGVEITVLGFELLDESWQLFNINLSSYQLNDEPLQPSFAIEKPVDDDKIVIGEMVNIQTYVAGLSPSNVTFYSDDTPIGTDDTYPFEILWEAEGDKGEHVIKAIADYGSETITSKVTIELVMGGWQRVDVSNVLSSESYILENVFFRDNQHGWILGRGGDVIIDRFCLYTEDGGKSWTKIYEGDRGTGEWADNFIFISEDIGYFSGAFIYKTTDGGHTWEYDLDASYVNLNEAGDLYAITPFEIYTIQSGVSEDWELVKDLYNENYQYEINGMSCPVDNTLFVIDGMYDYVADEFIKQAYKVTDNGNTWTGMLSSSVLDEMGGSLDYIHFVDNNYGWIIGYRWDDWTNHGFMSRTTNGGVTWSTDLTEVGPEHIFFLDRFTGYTVFSTYQYFAIAYTTDGGETWNDFDLSEVDIQSSPSFLPEKANLFFTDRAHGWCVYDNNLLIYGVTD